MYVDVSDERLTCIENDFLNYIDDIQILSQNFGMQSLFKITAHALKFTAKSTTLCIKYLLQQVGFYYVLTCTFTSDYVKATFCHIRIKGGSNDTTDAKTAEYAMKQILRCGIIKTSISAIIAQAESV